MKIKCCLCFNVDFKLCFCLCFVCVFVLLFCITSCIVIANKHLEPWWCMLEENSMVWKNILTPCVHLTVSGYLLTPFIIQIQIYFRYHMCIWYQFVAVVQLTEAESPFSTGSVELSSVMMIWNLIGRTYIYITICVYLCIEMAMND